MLLASLGLAALLLGAYFLTPVLILRYHAWMFRSGRDPEAVHLRKATKTLVAAEASAETVRHLLGQPNRPPYRNRRGEGPIYIYRCENDVGCEVVTVEGRAAKVNVMIWR
jgi:hypothetical protein